MIDSALVLILSTQAGNELSAHALYESLADWAARLGLTGTAAYCRASADEELGHKRQTLDFLRDYADEDFPQPAMDDRYLRPNGVVEACTAIWDAETTNYDQWNAVAQKASELRDMAVENFAQAMVDGQVKSVSQVTDILRYARIAGTDPAAMLSFDTFMAGQVPA